MHFFLFSVLTCIELLGILSIYLPACLPAYPLTYRSLCVSIESMFQYITCVCVLYFQIFSERKNPHHYYFIEGKKNIIYRFFPISSFTRNILCVVMMMVVDIYFMIDFLFHFSLLSSTFINIDDDYYYREKTIVQSMLFIQLHRRRKEKKRCEDYNHINLSLYGFLYRFFFYLKQEHSIDQPAKKNYNNNLQVMIIFNSFFSFSFRFLFSFFISFFLFPKT